MLYTPHGETLIGLSLLNIIMYGKCPKMFKEQSDQGLHCLLFH